MFWVLLLQSNHIWLFPAYIPDLRLLLYCFAIFIRTFNTFHLHPSCILLNQLYLSFNNLKENSDLGIKAPDLFPEMMLCGFRLAICLLWVWSVDWGDHFLGSPSENFLWEGGSHNDEPFKSFQKIFRGKLILNSELCATIIRTYIYKSICSDAPVGCHIIVSMDSAFHIRPLSHWHFPFDSW